MKNRRSASCSAQQVERQAHSLVSSQMTSRRWTARTAIAAGTAAQISVFAAFVLGDEQTIKMFGVGLAVAVLVDATIVRMVLVPAVMALLDRHAWWLPARLDAVLPNLDIEGESLARNR